MKKCFLILIPLMLLTGCVSRDEADVKLAHACRAGIQSLLPENLKIDHLTGHEASKSPEGNDMRYIKIKTVTIDGMLEEDKEYECIFEEQFGLMNMDYTASIYQVRTGEATYGKSGNEIMGDATVFLKLTDAIRQAMYETTKEDESGPSASGEKKDASTPAPAGDDANKPAETPPAGGN